MTKVNEDPCGCKIVYTPQGLKGDQGNPGSGLLKEVYIPISQADVLALNNTDKELLPPSPLFGYDIFSIIIKAIPVTIDYLYNAPSNDRQLKIKLIGPVGTTAPGGEITHWTAGIFENVNLYTSAGVNVPSTKFIRQLGLVPLWTTNSNSGIYLSTEDPSEFYTLGDHTFVAIVTYREI